MNANYIVFIFSLPLAIYHANLIKTKAYKQYAITLDEYKPHAKLMSKQLKIKLLVYIALVILTTISLMISSGNLLAYNIFGDVFFSRVL